ncbi:hypothetical protein CRG98_040036 [Punica granatum]|uniref:Uncharacterized protein n=1 Tax=Punica granatum TaxID=22663 RepID=A0A2I0I834_PUNGR|nr:hypothetical protein CRG98_040036 [Punica granatum]
MGLIWAVVIIWRFGPNETQTGHLLGTLFGPTPDVHFQVTGPEVCRSPSWEYVVEGGVLVGEWDLNPLNAWLWASDASSWTLVRFAIEGVGFRVLHCFGLELGERLVRCGADN